MLTFSTAEAIAPARRNLAPSLLLLIGCIVLAAGAAFGYYQQTRTERILVLKRPLVRGQQIVADDLGLLEVPLHRPQQLAGLTTAEQVVGKFAAGDARPNDVVQPALLLERRPDQPVYPSGESLRANMVVVPFATATVGPLTSDDVLNIGFNDPSGDPTRCQAAGDAAARGPSLGTDGKPQAYACRLVTGVNVLYVDDAKGVAYLELPPATAHVLWALQAAGLATWGERYGAGSQPLPPLERLDIGQAAPGLLLQPGQLPGSVSPDPTPATETSR